MIYTRYNYLYNRIAISEEELETYLNAIRRLVSSDEIGKSMVEAINDTGEALMRSLIISSTF